MFWICVFIRIYIYVLFSFFILSFLYFCSWLWLLNPNEDIVRFRSGGSHIPFLHVFLYSFLSFEVVLCLFGWFVIPICLVASLYISIICMIGHSSMV